MAVYTQLTDPQIAAFLADAYALGPLISATGIAQGVENSNYLITTQPSTGAPERHILTLYEKRVEPAELPFFLGLMQHVAQRGVACPAPIPRRDGALFGALVGKQAALVSFLPGASRRAFGRAHVKEVGQALAKLHRAMRDYTGTRENALSLPGWEGLYAKLAGRLDSIAPGLDALVADELSHLKKHWPGADAPLPVSVIHADLFPDNVFFEGDEVSGLIDFYFACNDTQTYDIAVTLNAWCFKPGGAFDLDKSTALIAGYSTLRRMTPDELDAFPTLLRGAALRFLLTRAHDWLHRAPDALVTPHDPLEYVAKLRFHRESAKSKKVCYFVKNRKDIFF